jgi:hypothetical protein
MGLESTPSSAWLIAEAIVEDALLSPERHGEAP